MGAIGGLVVGLAAVCLAACTGEGSSARGNATDTGPRSWSVLASPVEKVTFRDVKLAIADLYQNHPDLEAFVVRDVQYNAQTRNKVLDVCHRGGAEPDPAALESVRVAACAPLIFFFYSYGRDSSLSASLAVARKLYWYAVTNIRGPFDAGETLRSRLQTWGVT